MSPSVYWARQESARHRFTPSRIWRFSAERRRISYQVRVAPNVAQAGCLEQRMYNTCRRPVGREADERHARLIRRTYLNTSHLRGTAY